MATKKEINKALEKFGDMKIQRGKGYIYLTGGAVSSWKQTGIYGGSFFKNYTVEEIVRIVAGMKERYE